MTVIAWDGKTLAADKASTWVGYASMVTKIYRVPAGIIGFSGDGDHAMALLEWFREGMQRDKYPPAQLTEQRASGVLITLDRRILIYDKTPFPQYNQQPYYAIGAGRDYALAAMFLGHDARRAVEVACAIDINCGNGIDTLTLED